MGLLGLSEVALLLHNLFVCGAFAFLIAAGFLIAVPLGLLAVAACLFAAPYLLEVKP